MRADSAPSGVRRSLQAARGSSGVREEAPSTLVTMVGLPPSMAATAELVVPRSMPTTCSKSVIFAVWPHGSLIP